MSTIGRCLVPCCFASESTDAEVKSKSCCYSAFVQAVTSLALGIVIGAGIALAAFFLTRGSVMCSSLSGAGGVVGSSYLSYIVLRYICCRAPQRKPSQSDNKQNGDGSSTALSHHKTGQMEHTSSSMSQQQLQDHADPKNLAAVEIDAHAIVKRIVSPKERDLSEEVMFSALLVRMSDKEVKEVDLSSLRAQQREVVIDLSSDGEHPIITEARVQEILKSNPLLRELKVIVSPPTNDKWQPNFEALEGIFKAHQVSDVCAGFTASSTAQQYIIIHYHREYASLAQLQKKQKS